MFQAATLAVEDKTAFYRDLNTQLRGLLDGERDWIANSANLSSLLYLMLPDLNWAGFYFLRPTAQGSELILGPFQGKPACVLIPVAPNPKGVCGAAASQKRTQVVEDVHAFPGHIACDSASNSEIVVPLIKEGKLLGVLDLDSPKHARFDDEDREGLETLVATFLSMTDSPRA
jgi:L-methionine (R)-S-oxide reductase